MPACCEEKFYELPSEDLEEQRTSNQWQQCDSDSRSRDTLRQAGPRVLGLSCQQFRFIYTGLFDDMRRDRNPREARPDIVASMPRWFLPLLLALSAALLI